MKSLFTAAALLCLGACASMGSDGWSGQGAEPFDAARAACEAQSDMTLEACMASKGWTRTN